MTEPYVLLAIFGLIMLWIALLIVALFKPSTAAQWCACVPLALFILSLVAIPVRALTGITLVSLDMAEESNGILRLGVELLCLWAAWKCLPWLYLGKERVIDTLARWFMRR